jgi:hypothetical protein
MLFASNSCLIVLVQLAVAISAVMSAYVIHDNINELLYGKSKQQLKPTTGVPKRFVFNENNYMDQISDSVRTFGVKVTTEKSTASGSFSCSDKEDDRHYEHEDCKKYWHCLYVGSIFQTALERKCPPGTMFHPLLSTCELSTIVSSRIFASKINWDNKKTYIHKNMLESECNLEVLIYGQKKVNLW